MVRWPLLLTDFVRDAVHALRLFGRARAFTALAILTLALGVGANTAIFSVVHALLLRPLPYPEPDRLVFLDGAFRARGSDTAFQLSYPEMTDIAATPRSLTLLAPWTTGYGLALEGTAGAARLQANFVGRAYFDLLGARPLAGWLFADDDHERGGDGQPVALLSETAWRQQFGGDPSTVGRDVRLQGRLFTIVGIMPATFDDPALAYSERIDIWVPIERAPALVGVDLTARGSRLTWGFARLATGDTVHGAGRTDGDRPSARIRLSADECILHAARHAARAIVFPRRQTPAADAPRRLGVRAPDRLRQCRQSRARALVGTHA